MLAGTGIFIFYFHEKGEPVTGGIQTVQAVERDLSMTLLFSSTVVPQAGAEAQVYSKVTGTVKEILVSPGEEVERGQILLELEAEDMELLEIRAAKARAELEQAEARLRQVQEGASPEEIKQAENRLQEAKINLEHLHRQYERTKILFEDGFVAQLELEEIQKAIKLAEIKVEDARQHLSLIYKKYTAEDIASARAQVEQARINLKEAELRLQDAQVTSPIAGTVASVNVNPGETIGREGGSPLFTIIDLKRLDILVYVDEIEIGRISPGQKAVTMIDAFPGDEFVGTVSSISPLPIEDGTAIYFLVTVKLDEMEERLRPWLTADTEIYLEEREKVLAVPSEAVRRVGGRQVVYVEQDGSYQAREVEIGWRDLRYTEITSGLQVGERVVVEGFALIEKKEGV